ncbi:hypothetical protein [Paraburkholderia sp. ZP32-5]|uniref:hypothetical protein n=1 Tax=Paraburkholderia sp. ZP32-5 TaxID=2883245 RepID=UPI001F3C0DEF|nr:hypothetical protein [Paraburkholderia sp. ZP32-5]
MKDGRCTRDPGAITGGIRCADHAIVFDASLAAFEKMPRNPAAHCCRIAQEKSLPRWAG